MPKLYEYFGLIVFFYANEHEPVHVHGEYQGAESRAELIIVEGEIVTIRITNVEGRQPLKGARLRDFKKVVQVEANNILKSWIDYFVLGKKVKSKTITRRLK